METTAAFDGFRCTGCDATRVPEAAAGRCPDCGDALVADYDLTGTTIDRQSLSSRRFDGMERYEALLPVPAGLLPTMDEGTTPLVSCPGFAAELGVDAVYVKDEGANPTGTTADREMAVAVGVARERGATAVALPTTGDAGQSAAAYAARAGLDAHIFVPMRSTFVAKAMTNVHGGDMTVVEGRYPDAVAAFDEAMGEQRQAEAAWDSLAPFDAAARRDGAKTLLFEVVEQLDWSVPDVLVHPTGHGIGVAGSHLATDQLRTLGVVDEGPALCVAQPDACSPVVSAFEAGESQTDPWEQPDTLVGSLEVPDPAGGSHALDAVRSTGGQGVAVSDDEALEAAVDVAGEGVELSATGGVGAAALRSLAGDEHFDGDETVVVVNPIAGNKENDVLRSHLMRQGI